MRKFLKPVYLLIGRIKELYYKKETSKLRDGDYFSKYNIPSFTQWESRELIEKIINGETDCKKDPHWEKSGAKNIQEYEMYSWQCCGMACLKMILKSIDSNKNYTVVDLAKDALDNQAYELNDSKNVKDNLNGLIHKPFLKFIKKFNLFGKRIISIEPNYLAYLILNNYFLMASVHHTVRGNFYKNNPKNGHLVLVVGFRLKKGLISGFFINNPSGFSSNRSQNKYFVPLQKWNNCFSGDANILKSKQ